MSGLLLTLIVTLLILAYSVIVEVLQPHMPDGKQIRDDLEYAKAELKAMGGEPIRIYNPDAVDALSAAIQDADIEAGNYEDGLPSLEAWERVVQCWQEVER